jgi:predicted HTH domain antitoxin
MITKSIRLTEAEAAELRAYVVLTGEVEANVLKRAALRGLKDMRLEQAILAFIRGASSTEAAELAGIPRAVLLWELGERGVPVLQGPSTMGAALESLAEAFHDEKMAAVARKLAQPNE